MRQQMLERGNRFLAAREYTRGRAEFTALVQALGGTEREIAGVRVGAADYLEKKTEQACRYLQSLEVSSPEAGAERLYYLVECARRLNNESAIMAALDTQARHNPSSSSLLTALLASRNRFLL